MLREPLNLNHALPPPTCGSPKNQNTKELALLLHHHRTPQPVMQRPPHRIGEDPHDGEKRQIIDHGDEEVFPQDVLAGKQQVAFDGVYLNEVWRLEVADQNEDRSKSDGGPGQEPHQPLVGVNLPLIFLADDLDLAQALADGLSAVNLEGGFVNGFGDDTQQCQRH